MDRAKGPVVLCVLAGLGDGERGDTSALEQAATPTLDALFGQHPRTSLRASGEAVGLSVGRVGNGEAGHMTLGAGRAVPSVLARVDEAIAAGKLSRVPVLDQTVRLALYDECPVHLIGLVSDGGVHSDIAHLFKLIELFDFNEIPVVVHAIVDGYDTPPQSAMTYLGRLEGHIETKQKTRLGTIGGRHWAMDRNGRWDRVYRAYHAIVRDKVNGSAAPQADTTYDAVSMAYSRGVTDSLIEPTRIGDYQGINGDFLCDFSSQTDTQVWEWTGMDVGLAFNFRGDRLRQLMAMFTRTGVPDYVSDDLLMDRHFPMLAFRPKCLASLASVGDGVAVQAMFPSEPVAATLGEVLASHGKRQLRVGESEKRAHVTQFFNGGREAPFEGEKHKVVASPKFVDTYDQQPEMSAAKVATATVEGLESSDYDFVLVNFANPDTVAHSGDLEATQRAMVAVDQAVAQIAKSVKERGGVLLITSDHGNAESLVTPQGNPHPGHTKRRVPFVLVGDQPVELRPEGSLGDVAPTVLDLLGIDKPAEMTGSSLCASTNDAAKPSA